MVIMHPRCICCGQFIQQQGYLFPQSTASSKPSKAMYIEPREYYCSQCVEKIPTERRNQAQIVHIQQDEVHDKNPRLQSSVFASRQGILGIMQENQYQFNELRHAQSSSVSILRHCLQGKTLFSPWKCCMCMRLIVTGWCWLCVQCYGYHVCDECKELSLHPHKFIKINSKTMISENQEEDLFLLSMVAVNQGFNMPKRKLRSSKKRGRKSKNSQNEPDGCKRIGKWSIYYNHVCWRVTTPFPLIHYSRKVRIL